jgi:threonylcarbamoyladenosine tRNA methylthiotransferase MtaB
VKGYYIENFGCRAAQADGSAIERQLVEQGMHRVSAVKDAEVAVLNTCTVTSAADQDARAAVRRVHRARPGAKILVTGCYAQRVPEEISALKGVTWVVGNSHKHHIGDIVGASNAGANTNFVPLTALQHDVNATYFAEKIHSSDIFAHTELLSAPVFEAIERTRPNLKVQDGCDNRCSFCVIPYVRGRSRSLAMDKILHEVRELERAGYREIVISGINLGRWGRDFAPQNHFVEMLREVLEHSSIEKLRLSSVEPMDWTDELIALMASSPRIAKHAHIPLQSGSDRILRQMHRKYRPWHYAEKVEKIRKLMPDAAIGADVMVGFPGESEELFEESRRFIARLPFTYLHVFTYSARPGTPAAQMSEQIPPEVARERNRRLREVAAEKNLAFRRTFLERQLHVITLKPTQTQSTEALSDNFLKVKLEGVHAANQWREVRIHSLSDSGLNGTFSLSSSATSGTASVVPHES